jgi:hypothetical protein
MLSDTTPEAERIQVELLRAMPVEQRRAQMYELNALTKSLSLRAIERARPGISEADRDHLFRVMCWGRELADKYRAALEEWKTANDV